MEILAIEGLTKNFYLHNLGKTIKSCRDIGFTLHEGEFIGLVGRSGAGKSSILKCINRTYLPLQGTIVYNSQAFGPIDLAQADERQMLQLRRYEIGYVAQFLNVMPRTTAKEHVIGPLFFYCPFFTDLFISHAPKIILICKYIVKIYNYFIS